MSRVELSEGAWAELFDPARLTLGRRRSLERAVAAVLASGAYQDAVEHRGDAPSVEVTEAMFNISDTEVLAFVSSWSFGDVTREVLENEVPGSDFDVLSLAVQPLLPQLRVSFDPAPDPTTGVPDVTAGPTEPSPA